MAFGSADLLLRAWRGENSVKGVVVLVLSPDKASAEDSVLSLYEIGIPSIFCQRLSKKRRVYVGDLGV